MKPPTPSNLYAELPPAGPQEDFSILLARPGVRIERIVSDGHASPPGFWYDQDEDEWVMLAQGEGVLEYEGGARCTLRPGDWLAIPAHTRHRVAHTAPRTVWLAVFVAGAEAAKDV